MQVSIDEVASTVRAVDGDALLAPRTLQSIVAAVLQAFQDAEAHRMRVSAETRVTDGVGRERKEEGRP